MSKVQIKIKPTHPDAKIPFRGTERSAAMDLSSVEEDFVLDPGCRRLVDVGFCMSIEDGYFAYVRPRSGLATKFGIDICTSGVIDSDYRGPIKVTLINHSSEPFKVEKGSRIAQMLILPVPEVDLLVVDELSDTTRGVGGFGHTGK